MKLEQLTYSLESEEKVIFVFPIYAWSPPQLVVDFIKKLSFNGSVPSYLSVVVTCGENIGETERVIQTGKNRGKINRAYKYGMGLYWIGAQVALRRIPRKIANTLNLYIFSIYDDGWVKQWTPKDFGKSYLEDAFRRL